MVTSRVYPLEQAHFCAAGVCLTWDVVDWVNAPGEHAVGSGKMLSKKARVLRVQVQSVLVLCGIDDADGLIGFLTSLMVGRWVCTKRR